MDEFVQLSTSVTMYILELIYYEEVNENGQSSDTN